MHLHVKFHGLHYTFCYRQLRRHTIKCVNSEQQASLCMLSSIILDLAISHFPYFKYILILLLTVMESRRLRVVVGAVCVGKSEIVQFANHKIILQ